MNSSLPQNSNKVITLPTLFTIGRIILTPIIAYYMIHEVWYKAFYLFLIASFTDIIDGALARFLNVKTFIGASLDAFADKFLLVSCFSSLAFINNTPTIVPSWFVFSIMIKELILIIGCIVIYYNKGSLAVQPTYLGKFTTFVQICFIVWFFACYFFNWHPFKTNTLFLLIILGFVAASLIQYICIGIKFVLSDSGK